MEMVSTAKYKQSHTRIANSAPYQQKLREMMADLASAGAEVSHPLLESRPVKRSLILLITSNRGLCGGYNSNLNALGRRTRSCAMPSAGWPETWPTSTSGWTLPSASLRRSGSGGS